MLPEERQKKVVKPKFKLTASSVAIFFVIAAAGVSLSQEKNQLPAGQKKSDTLVDVSGGSTGIDDLKRYRSAAENAGDLTEDLKKAVVNLIDRAIIYREREARLQEEIGDVKQQVQTAPERIEAIENELNQPLQPPENVAG